MDGPEFQPIVAIAGGGFDQHAAVLDLLRASFAEQEGRIDPPSSVTSLTLDGVLRDASEGDLLTVEAAEEIIGCAFTSARENDQGRYLYAYHIAIAPQHRRRGLATQLFETIDMLARARGLERVMLMCRIELKENHALFEANGFSRSGVFTHDGFNRPTSLQFTKSLV
ncbi:MAG: GNAT family N-acetyltransferase [Alphaproteobacteria bacterium]|nr:GNAT family N-acetyltransferase [Alphaproteobacteria bacterium]